MLIRHDADGKMYLYDIMDIKKKRATLSNHEVLLGKNPFLFSMSVSERWGFVNKNSVEMKKYEKRFGACLSYFREGTLLQ